MSEIGESTELVEELFMESLKEDRPSHRAPKWHKRVAFSSLVLALLAALGGLLAGMTAHESLLERTKEIIDVSRLEGDRISVELLQSKHEILTSLGEAVDPAEVAIIEAYEEEAADLAMEAAVEEVQVRITGYTHLVLAIAVTVLSVGITLGGMAVVVEERYLWIAGIVIGLVGAVTLIFGVVIMLL